jgi:hypothetical protein
MPNVPGRFELNFGLDFADGVVWSIDSLSIWCLFFIDPLFEVCFSGPSNFVDLLRAF